MGERWVRTGGSANIFCGSSTSMIPSTPFPSTPIPFTPFQLAAGVSAPFTPVVPLPSTSAMVPIPSTPQLAVVAAEEARRFPCVVSTIPLALRILTHVWPCARLCVRRSICTVVRSSLLVPVRALGHQMNQI